MGCFSRRKEKPVLQEHKFAYVVGSVVDDGWRYWDGGLIM